MKRKWLRLVLGICLETSPTGCGGQSTSPPPFGAKSGKVSGGVIGFLIFPRFLVWGGFVTYSWSVCLQLSSLGLIDQVCWGAYLIHFLIVSKKALICKQKSANCKYNFKQRRSIVSRKLSIVSRKAAPIFWGCACLCVWMQGYSEDMSSRSSSLSYWSSWSDVIEVCLWVWSWLSWYHGGLCIALALVCAIEPWCVRCASTCSMLLSVTPPLSCCNRGPQPFFWKIYGSGVWHKNAQDVTLKCRLWCLLPKKRWKMLDECQKDSWCPQTTLLLLAKKN